MKLLLFWFWFWALSALASYSDLSVVGTFWQTTQPISVASLPLALGAAAEHTAANSPNACRLSDGTSFLATLPVSLASLPALAASSAVIGHVINDASSAVIGHVVADSGSTTTVTGTVTTNATLAAETTKVIGTVNVAASQTIGLASGSAVVGHVINDASSAVIGHVVVDTAPTTAVTIASLPALTTGSAVIGHVIADSGSTTAVTGTVTANATLSAETTKVIGTVNVAAAQTVGLAAGSAVVGHVINDASSAVIGHVIADSGSTTAVTGTVTVTQATTGGNPCLNPGATLVSANGATSGTTAVQIVGLSGTTKIYLCSLTVIGVSGTTPTFSLVQGTGSNCVTSQTVVVQSWTTAAGSIYAFANPVAVGVAGQELCYLNTGTTPVQRYTLTYVQQ